MAQNTTELGIKLTLQGTGQVQQGVREIGQQMGNLGSQAQTASAGADKLTQSLWRTTNPAQAQGVRSIAQALGKISPAAQTASAGAEKLATTTSKIATTQVQQGVRTVAQELGKVGPAAKAASDSTQALTGHLARMGHTAAAALGVQKLIGMADAVTELNNKLRLATGSSQAAASAYGELFTIANRSKVSFTELGSTFASMARATQGAGISQQRLLTVTEAIGNSMTISSGSAESMNAALVQLGQGIASGVLRGEELNSVMEQNPRLAQALADGMKVPLGRLRELGAQGQITTQQIIEALESQSQVLQKEVAGSVTTVSQALVRLGNATTDAVGKLDKASGATAFLSQGIAGTASVVSGLAAHADKVTVAIGVLAAVLAGRMVGSLALFRGATVASTAASAASTAAMVRQQAAALAQAGAVAVSSRAMLAATAQNIAMTAAATAGRMAMGALSGVVGLLGGPVGALVTVAGLAAGALYTMRSRADELVQSLGGLSQPLEELKQKIEALPAEKKLSLRLQMEQAHEKALKDTQQAFDGLIGSVNELAQLGEKGGFGGRVHLQKYEDLAQRLREAEKNGQDLAPVLEQAAKAGEIPDWVLRKLADAAAKWRELREATGQYQMAAGLAAQENSAKAQAAASLVSAEAAAARARAQAVLDATKGYKSQAEQMDEVRQSAKGISTELSALQAAGLGASKEARLLEQRLDGVNEKLKSMGKQGKTGGSGGASSALQAAARQAAELAQAQMDAARQSAQAQIDAWQNAGSVLAALHSAGLITERDYYAQKQALLAQDSQLRIAALEQENQLLAAQKKTGTEALARDRQIAKNRAEIATLEQQAATQATVLSIEQAAKRAEEAKAIEQQVAKHKDEAQVRELATRLSISQAQAMQRLTLARLQDQLAAAKAANNHEEIAALEREIAARKELLTLLDSDAAREAQQRAAEEAAQAWDKTASTIGQTLADYIMGGGRDAAQYLKRLFSTLVLQPVVNAVVGNTLGVLGLGGMPEQGKGSLNNLANLASVGSKANSALAFVNGEGLLGSVGAGIFGSTAAYAAAVPGLSAMGVGSQAAMLAAQTGTFGAAGTAATAAAGSGAAGAGSIGSALSAIPGWGWAAMAAVAVLGNVLSRKTKKVDGGIAGTLGEEEGVRQFDLMRKSGSLFGGPKYSYKDRGVSSLDADLQTAFAHMKASAAQMAQSLGLATSGLDGFTTRLGDELIHPDTGGYGLKLDGLSEEEVQAKIAQAMLDANVRVAEQLLGTWEATTREVLGDYTLTADGLVRSPAQTQEVRTYTPSEYALEGENALETLSRLAGSLGTVNDVLKDLNHQLFDGSLAGADLAWQLSELFGGMQALSDAAGVYYEHFFTEEERRRNLQTKLGEALAQVDISLPDIDASNARAQYRALVEAQDLNTEAGQRAYTALLQLSGAFASITASAEEAFAATSEHRLAAMLGSFTVGASAIGDIIEQAATNASSVLEAQTLASNAFVEQFYNNALGGLTDSLGVLIHDTVVQPMMASLLEGAALAAADMAAGGAASGAAAASGGSVGGSAVALGGQMAADAMAAAIDSARSQISAMAQILNDAAVQEGIRDIANLIGDISGSTHQAYSSVARAAQTSAEVASNAASSAEDAAKAARQATDDALRGLQTAVDAQRQLHQGRMDALQEQIAAEKSLLDMLGRHVKDLRGNVDATAQMAAAQGQRTIAQALAAWRSTGYLPEVDSLSPAIDAVRNGLKASAYATRLDYEAAQLILANQLQTLHDAAGEQLSVDEQLLAHEQAQLQQLEALLEAEQQALEVQRGTWQATLSVEEAVQQLHRAMAAEPGGLRPSIGTSAQVVSAAALPGFAVGINRVPQDMLARIHRDEAIVPAAYNPFNPHARQPWQAGAGNTSTATGQQQQTQALERIYELLYSLGRQQVELLQSMERLARKSDAIGIKHRADDAQELATP